MTYEVKKKYAEQGKIAIVVYENGVEKTKKLPLVDIEFVVDDKTYNLRSFVREFLAVKQEADKVPILEAKVLKLKESVAKLIDTLKGEL